MDSRTLRHAPLRRKTRCSVWLQICGKLWQLMTYRNINCVDMEQARSVSERSSSCHGCGGGAISVKIFPFGQYVTLADGLLDDGQVNAVLAIICWSDLRTWIASYLSLACRIWFVWLAQKMRFFKTHHDQHCCREHAHTSRTHQEPHSGRRTKEQGD